MGRWGFVKSAGGGVFTPASLTSLTFWLDGNDVLDGSNPTSNTKFDTWVDKSSNSFDFTQVDSALQFTYGSAQVDSKDVVVGTRADHTNMVNASVAISTGSPFTMFFTFVLTSGLTNFCANLKNGVASSAVLSMSTGGDLIMLIQNGSWVGSEWAASIDTSTVYMLTIGYNGSGAGTAGNYFAKLNGSTLSRNGDAVGSGAALTAIGSDVADPAFSMGGYFLDWALMGAVATSDEQDDMLAYEQAKWGF